MRRKITNETWEQIKTAYAAGIGLREIARKMNIPEGTVLARVLDADENETGEVEIGPGCERKELT
jgi:DNA invertase Pin-like site-specific DNA recombinase